MEKKTVRIAYEIELSYDPNSPEFKEAYESYTEVCDKRASIDDMLNNVAVNVLRRGAREMVEGVGYVKVDGREVEGQPFSGIIVENDDPYAEVE